MSDQLFPLPYDLTPVNQPTEEKLRPLPEDLTPAPRAGVFQIPSDLKPVYVPSPKELEDNLRQALTPEALDMFQKGVNDLTKDAEDPDEAKAKLYNSLLLSMITGQKPDQVYAEHDAWVRTWTGREEKPTTFLRKLHDAFLSGWIPGEIMPLGWEQLLGNDSAELEKRITDLEAQIPATERFMESLPKDVKEKLPEKLSSGEAFGASAITNLVGPALAPFLGPIWPLLMLTMKPVDKLLLSLKRFRQAREAVQKTGKPAPSFMESGIMDAAPIFATQLQSALYGAPWLLTAGGGVAAGGLLALAMGVPEAALAAIPLLPIAMRGGYLLGSAEFMGKLEGVMEYRTLRNLEYTNPQGQKVRVNPVYTKAISFAVGAINGLIEMEQFAQLIQPFGGEKLFREALTNVTRRSLVNGSMTSVILKALGRGIFDYGKDIVFETAEEVAQEGVSALGEEVSKYIENKVGRTEFQQNWSGIFPRLWETAKRSARGFAFMAAAGGLLRTAQMAIGDVKEKEAQDAAIAVLQQRIPGLTDSEARAVLKKTIDVENKRANATREAIAEGRLILRDAERESRRTGKPVQQILVERAEQRNQEYIVREEVVFRQATPEEFATVRNQMEESRKPFITLYTPEELRGPDWAGSRFFVSEKYEGKVGYAISPSGELFNLYNNSGIRGAGQEAIIDAIHNGTTNLFAFETLEPLYEQYGFKTYKRESWNPEYAPANWDYARYGTPDVIYMNWQGESREPADVRANAQVVRERTAQGPGGPEGAAVSAAVAAGQEGPGLGEEQPGPTPEPVGVHPEPVVKQYNPDHPRKFKEPVFAIQVEDGSIYYDPVALDHFDVAESAGISQDKLAGAGFIMPNGQYKPFSAWANPFRSPRERLVVKLKELQKINPQFTDPKINLFLRAFDAVAKARGLTINQMLVEDLTDEMLTTELIDEVPSKTTNPLYQVGPLYHGSGSEFAIPDLNYVGSGFGTTSFAWGLYFTTEREIAEWYAAKMAARKGLAEGARHLYEVTVGRHKENLKWLDWHEKVDRTEMGRIGEALRIHPELVIDATPRRKGAWDRAIAAFEKYAQNEKFGLSGADVYQLLTGALGSDRTASMFLRDQLGYDGATYKDFSLVSDRITTEPGLNYVLFDASQAEIDQHILFNTYRAAVQFAKDGRALIYASKHADLDSLLHEMFHIWRRKINDSTSIKVLSDFVGKPWGEWGRKEEEKLAEAGVQYLAEGKAPSEQLAGLFSQFKKWLRDTIDLVRESDLPADVRKAFDRLFFSPGTIDPDTLLAELLETEHDQTLLYDLLPPGTEEEQAERTRREEQNAKELEGAYAAQRNIWFANKDERLFLAKIEQRRLQQQLQRALADLGVAKKELRPRGRQMDEAIQVYIDTKRNPGHVQEFWDQLTEHQQKVVDLSQHLPDSIRAIADTISELYAKIGKEAKDHEILQNLISNYAARVWDLQGKETAPALRKFGTKTHHAKHREFQTILEGWANGYTLKVNSATVALRMYKEEMVKVIEDRRFLKALARMRNEDGQPLLTDRFLENYRQIEHPNFKLWKYAGTTKADVLMRNIREYHEQVRETRTSGGEAGPTTPRAVQKLEEVIVHSLMARGFTEGEATNALTSVKRAGSKEEVTTVIKEIEKTISERPEVLTTTFRKVFGKNFVLGAEGAILEKREVYAPNAIAKNINSILGHSKLMERPVIHAITKLNNVIKHTILTTSLFHHLAFVRSYYFMGLAHGWKDLNFIQAYKTGRAMIDAANPEILMGVRNGLTLGLIQDWDEDLRYEPSILNRWMDKVNFAKGLREGLRNFQQWWTDHLFESFGAGLKAKSFLIELHREMKKYPDQDPNVIATRVADMVNDDFGGLHLGRMGRNPTTQHIFRLLFLAPDWTESNFRQFTKFFGIVLEGGDLKKIPVEERRAVEAMFVTTYLKGFAATVFLNFMLAGGNPDRFLENYRQAVADGNLHVLDINLTPLYRALGGTSSRRKYFSLLGHFMDPIKWSRYPLRTIRHKSSAGGQLAIELLTARDWAGRRFTSFSDLLRYKQTVTWRPLEEPETDYSWLPSFIINQLVGSMPIQLQNLLAAISGEQDWFESFGNSIGLQFRSTY